MKPQRQPLVDREIVQMLISEPELLAIADALVATKESSSANEIRSRQRPFRSRDLSPIRIAVVGAIVVSFAVAALLLSTPWSSGPTLVERALAAVGSEQVLHVEIADPPASGDPVIDLETGKTVLRKPTTEIWFARRQNLKRTVVMLDGKTLDEALETAQGGWTRTGPIYTCAWIVSHPDEAAQARVSCAEDDKVVRGPPAATERVPQIDPALAGFVDHYQSALASGSAQKLGTGEIEGREVLWLGFVANSAKEEVAIDAKSYKPVLIRQRGGTVTLRVLRAETVSYDPDLFRKPRQVPAQSGGRVTSERPVTVSEAASILGGRLVWLGASWRGLKLTATKHQRWATGFGSKGDTRQADVIALRYAPIASAGNATNRSRIDIYQAAECILSVGWTCTARDPDQTGTILLRGPISLLRQDGRYVSIWNWTGTPSSLEIARSLGPLEVE